MVNHRDNLLKTYSEKGEYWKKILTWFKKHKPKDKGIQFIWDSLFTDKYLQSKHMLTGMMKLLLYYYRAKNDKTFPYEYSEDRINIITAWFENYLKLTTGPFQGKPFIPEPNQIYKFSLIYGLSKKEKFLLPEQKDKGIIFATRKMYDVETRKNGKSQFYAGLANFVIHNPFGNDYAPECYFTGPMQDTSKIIYDKAWEMTKQNHQLLDMFEAWNLRRCLTYGGGKMKDLPFEVAQLEGKSPSLAIATEYHLHPNDVMINSMESASALNRVNSLLVFDTTKGEGIYGVAYVRENDYKDITIQQLDNPKEIIGIDIATFMAEIDEEDTLDDIDNPWESNILRKSTPMIGVTISLEQLQQEWATAKMNPTRKREFIIKKVGRWLGNLQSVITLADMQRADALNSDRYKLEDFKNKQCYIAVDLANTGDTNAVTLFFKDVVDNQEIPIGISKIFIPEETLKERIEKERKPYLAWIEKGWVQTSGQKAVDHGDIAEYIFQCLREYKVQKVLFDPYQAHIITNYLIKIHNIPESYFEEVKQRAANLSSPMEDLIKKVADGNMYFFGNQTVIDHFVNVKPSFNSQGQIYWTKQKQTQRVDIFATWVTAMSKLEDLPQYNQKQTVGVESWSF